MERIYRFEGLLNGIPQGVGLFQELDEMALPISEVRELTGLFDSLPCPDLDEPVSFWFTDDGRTLRTHIKAEAPVRVSPLFQGRM